MNTHSTRFMVLLLNVAEHNVNATKLVTLLNLPGQNVAVQNITFPKLKSHNTSNVPKDKLSKNVKISKH